MEQIPEVIPELTMAFHPGWNRIETAFWTPGMVIILSLTAWFAFRDIPALPPLLPLRPPETMPDRRVQIHPVHPPSRRLGPYRLAQIEMKTSRALWLVNGPFEFAYCAVNRQRAMGIAISRSTYR